jgi:alpha-beta hydrolase superfamily lysophospholipase
MLYGIRANTVDADPIAEDNSKYSANLRPLVTGMHSPWKRQLKQSEAPGIVWLDPSVETKAILICVHGLGLHHHSFDSFCRRVAPDGIMSIAFDVRGFGTYVEANGFEKLSMDECVEDLRSLTKTLRRDYPNFPIFLMGESMGGALALRVVAKSPENIDGLICSVPAGTRYKSLTQAIHVGAEFLKNKNKPIAVETVVNQATSSEELRKAWLNDPYSRLQITPEELLNFQAFMDQNPEYAKQIVEKPVILFQGHDDKLVKESGTLDLFNALGTPKKSLVLIGNTEHLIFEAGQFKDEITLGVIGWMIANSPNKCKKSPELSVGTKQ